MFPRIAMWLAVLSLVVFGLWLLLRTRLTVSEPDALASGRDLLRARRVLVFTAHPDDCEWWISGTLRRLALSGADVRLVIATTGEKGPNRTSVDDLAATRREEALAAARVMGCSQVVFLGLPDRQASTDPKLPGLIRREWTAFKPDAVVTFDGYLPALPYLHPDHEGVGRMVEAAWKELGGALLWLFHSRRPNAVVDISSVIKSKVEALGQHRTHGLDRAAERIRRYNRGGLRVRGDISPKVMTLAASRHWRG